MKQLHNISNLYSGQRGTEPMGQGYACVFFLIVNLWEKGAYIHGSANELTRPEI
jgi:hypothetical protein